MFFVIVGPDGPVGGHLSMRDAQDAIDAITPEITERQRYVIHPIANAKDAEAARIKVHWRLELKKFDGETGELVETLEREGVN